MERMPLVSEERVFGHYLAVQRPAACPEIALWLVHGEVDLNARCEELLNGGYAPYWAFCWGAGQALARHLLDHPHLVRGKHVVDFGAGSGVAGIAAALAGASAVTAVDIDERALTFCDRNASMNGVTLRYQKELPPTWDVLLASDVLYEVSLRDQLLRWAKIGKVIVADPQRPGNPSLELTPVTTYTARCLPDVDYPVQQAAIYYL